MPIYFTLTFEEIVGYLFSLITFFSYFNINIHIYKTCFNELWKLAIWGRREKRIKPGPMLTGHF